VSFYFKKKFKKEIDFLGFGTDGIWVPVALNDGFVLSKYSPGQYFKPHRDGLYINGNEEHSIFSVVIYLNQGSSFKGGNLNFIAREGEEKKKAKGGKLTGLQDVEDRSNIIATYRPSKGEAIIFNSDALHEGEALEAGYKYIMRTFVMFRRVTRFDEQIDYGKDKTWVDTLKLFASFDTLHVNGDTYAFTRAYLEAQEAQLRHRRTLHAPTGPFPIDVFRLIFAYLGASDVMKAMRLSRAWYESGRDNVVWQRLYQQQFTDASTGKIEFDWFTKYKSASEKALSIFVIGDAVTFSEGIVLFCIREFVSALEFFFFFFFFLECV
jgi:hypothetical protein